MGAIIKDIIADETLVMSDEWPAYMSFFGETQAYQHLSVNHKQNFVDPVTHAHTQNIERVWGKLKLRLRAKNYRRRDKLPLYVDEFCFRESFKKKENSKYLMFLEIIRNLK